MKTKYYNIGDKARVKTYINQTTEKRVFEVQERLGPKEYKTWAKVMDWDEKSTAWYMVQEIAREINTKDRV
jgi:hypothetical protein